MRNRIEQQDPQMYRKAGSYKPRSEADLLLERIHEDGKAGRDTIQSYLKLGDVYFDMLEPEKAISAYEAACKQNPKDCDLVRKVGQALVRSHLFDKAVTYYKAAIKRSGTQNLRYDLALLLFKLGKWRESQELSQSALALLDQDTSSEESNLTHLEWDAKFTHLLAQIQLQTDKREEGMETLARAHALQIKVVRRTDFEKPDSLEEEKKVAINMSLQLGELILNYERDAKKAASVYKKALSIDENNTKILMALAKVEMSEKNLSNAQRYCTILLKHSRSDPDCLSMMADLLLYQHDFESALTYYRDLIESKHGKNMFNILVRYIEAARRIGQLDLVPATLEYVKKNHSSSISEPAMEYCNGLYEWYTGDTTTAMKCLNLARQESSLEIPATYNMIQICINPDNEVFGGGTFDASEISIPMERSHDAAIKTAEKLLHEMKPKCWDDITYRLLSSFVLLASKSKQDAEMALSDFLKILAEDRYKNCIGAIFGSATAYMIIKQIPKARNQLKRISNLPWNLEDADYLEKSWLLLCDTHASNRKYDLSIELLKKILYYNKSCAKAYEYHGFIMEREAIYKDACLEYERAWKLTRGNNPVIGYRLAFNYMKAKRYVDAIDVSRALLEKYPEYPKVRREILERCLNSLKS